jgi:hypothetical protein
MTIAIIKEEKEEEKRHDTKRRNGIKVVIKLFFC